MSTAAPGVAAAPSTPQTPATNSPESPAHREVGPRLPGVVDDLDDGEQPRRKIAPIRDRDRDARPAIERIGQPDRDATGRFLPRSADGTPIETQEPGSDDAPAVDDTGLEQPEEPTAQKFVFAGIEFESQEKAEQNFKTLRGQYKSLEAKAKTAATERNQVATVANQWKAEAERARAELQALRTGGAAPQPQTQNPKGTAPASDAQRDADAQKAFEESVDWDFYRELHEAKGPQYAQFWLMREMRGFMTDFVKRELGQTMAPFQERQQVMQKLQTVADLFERTANLTDESGNHYLPELHDEAAQPVIAQLYVQLGFDPTSPNPELGIHYAVLAYRDWLSKQGGGAAPSPSSPAAPTAPLLRHLNAEQQAQSQVFNGNGTPRPATAGEAPGQRLKKAIREAGRLHPGLGFGE